MLHLLGTLDRPDDGTIHLEGRRIDNLPAQERDELRNRTFGFIFQFYHLLPEFNTLENVLTPAMITHGVWSWFVNRRTLRKHRAGAAGARRLEPSPEAQAEGTVRRRDAARRHRPGPHQSAARAARR